MTASDQIEKRIIFYRDFQSYTGGHQKVADYFEHCLLHQRFLPEISFSENSVWDLTNPWARGFDSGWVANPTQNIEFKAEDYDCIFLAGLDWHIYPKAEEIREIPVINLIQHVRHGAKDSDVFPFLKRRAIRVCVSPEVTEAISSTGQVNGPVITIPNGYVVNESPKVRRFDLFVLGCKNPEVSRQISDKATEYGLSFEASDRFLPRERIWDLMASSRVSVCLPHSTEGFYLPALEAMALSDFAVVPDCIGNRGFCIPGKNCLMPEYDVASIMDAVFKALRWSRPTIANNIHNRLWRRHVKNTLQQHSLLRERRSFFEILDNVEQLW